jgi:hypothetical protein
LSLPINETIDPATVRVADVPLARLAYLDVKKLPDEALLLAYQKAVYYRHVRALRLLAAELVARPALEEKVDRAEVYGVLTQFEPDMERALTYIDKARQAAEAKGRSSATWDLTELSLQLARGDVAESERLLQHIRAQHLREPGVAQALFQLLADAGIIGPDGLPTAGGAGAPSGLVVPGAPQTAGAAPGKIWTPGTAAATGKKSEIWTPD